MEVKEEHKELLKSIGLKEKDFELFDDKYVRYEFEEEKGVRIYDPYYATSYNEYIGIDGWSAWSSENDTFMSDILAGAREEVRRREQLSQSQDEKEFEKSLEDKFKPKLKTRPE